VRGANNFILGLSVAAGLIISPLFVLNVHALGMEVDPAEINLKNVPLGEKIAISVSSEEKMKLTIQNKGAVAYTYTIDIFPVSETAGSLKKGYINISDTSWIWPEKREVLIQGDSVKEVELFLKVPDEENYKDKNFQAEIEIKSKKNSPEEVFVVAVRLRMFFST
jgi:hypothetical protein